MNLLKYVEHSLIKKQRDEEYIIGKVSGKKNLRVSIN